MHSTTDNDEIDLIELAVIWLENLKFGIAAVVLLAFGAAFYAFNAQDTLIVSSNIVIGNKLSGDAAISARDLAQILRARYNINHEFSTQPSKLPYLQQVTVNKDANMLQLNVKALELSSGTQLLTQIISQVLQTYNETLERERQQARQHISTLNRYIKQVQSNKNLANNVDLTTSYNTIHRLQSQLENAKSTTTIPELPDFYLKSQYSFSQIMALIVIISMVMLFFIPLLFAAAQNASKRFIEIRKLRSTL